MPTSIGANNIPCSRTHRVIKQINNLEMPHDSMPGSEVTYYKLPIKVKFNIKVSFNSKMCCKTLFLGAFA